MQSKTLEIINISALSFLFIILACIFTACEDDYTDIKTLENTGRVVINEIKIDDEQSKLEIETYLSTCLSGCSVDIEATCKAVVNDNEIRITASGSYRETLHGDCNDEKARMVPDCETVPLEHNLYSITYGNNEGAFETGIDAGTLHLGKLDNCVSE